MAERLSYSTSMAIGAYLVPSASRRAVTRSLSPFFPSSSPARFNVCLRSSSAISFNPLRLFERLERGGPSSSSAMYATCAAASDVSQLKSAREDIKELLTTKFCHPILVRLGWHDAGTYDKNIEEWPQRGGANGSLRFEVELKHAANAGLVNALKLIQPIKDKYPGVTYADLFQLASATAIEEAGGPKIPMKYGRVDVSGSEQCPEEGKLPDGPGSPGGQSWTVQWLKFDNSYFKDIKERRDEDLLVLPTDATLFDDPSFKVYAEKYAVDQNAFFKDYAEAHAKLSNLGAKFDPPEGLSIDDGAPEKFVAAKYSTGKA